MQSTHHVGLTVRDLERSVEFYHGTLGLEFVLAPTDWLEDDHLPEALGVDAPALLRIAAFKVGDGGTVVELLEYAKPLSQRDRALVQNEVGACHVGFQVDDIDRLVQDLRAKDVPFNSVVHDIEEGPFGGWRWVYFKDTDGQTIEFGEVRWQDDEQRAKDIRDYLASHPA